MMSFRTPDYFDMYTFNDHSAYGAVEVVQNLLLDFDEAFKAKQWREAWTVVEGLGMFMLVGAGSEMAMADDGDMVRRTAEQIVRMVLTGLAFHQREISPEGRAGDDLNVGHIIAIYLGLADQFRDAGLLDEASASKAKTFSFRGSNLDLYLRGWAQKNNIAVPEVEITSEDGNIILPSTSNKDGFGWTKSFADYSRTCHIPSFGFTNSAGLGGDGLDVTTWSAKARKDASFSGKDPLPPSQMKMIKEGMVMSPAG
jgi:hypothetical protein